ncbi:T9SS type A sorting domain-containing protein [Spirosoma sp.]|uniref:T9SS type A sorting domain-containing protein n=1 Tax=Spirosoma sp. TaxID=1899569 RepID=UPI0026304EE4|nr:T9SS type A sorting domain-containing protein [Spirosoma sp.]MCX6214780.1 T9SS type A sorting domain-containing protein [Spirosoma sp.]
MKKALFVGLLLWLVGIAHVRAQTTPFTANWTFEGNDNGTTSSGLVTASGVTYTGVNPLAVNPYTAGYVNLGVNVQNWSTSVCNQTEYVQFSVQRLGTATITLTSLSFAFARSAQGPTQLTVRSSADGFGNDIYSQGITTNYQVASIALNGAGFTNQEGPVTFRIYACNPTAGGGTLKLDEIQLNASVLPVTLLSFKAIPQGDRVQLAWETVSERNASHFRVDRSPDLGEYVYVGEVAAGGNSNERQYYGVTDMNPRPGINYYRLTQLDADGTAHTYKPVSAIVRSSDPVVAVYPNPASPDRIHIRLWNADTAVIRLLSGAGQTMEGRLERRPGEAALLFAQPLPQGVYSLEIQLNDSRQFIKVLVL